MFMFTSVRLMATRKRLQILGLSVAALAISAAHPAMAHYTYVETVSAEDVAARPSLTQGTVQGVDFSYRPLLGKSLMQDENFYLITLFEQEPAASKAMRAEPGMEAVRKAVIARVQAAVTACTTALTPPVSLPKANEAHACSVNSMRLTDGERAQTIAAMDKLFDRSSAVRNLVKDHMRPSGRFHRDSGMNDKALLLKAWTEALDGIDRLIRVYGLGEKPRYHDIDSVIYDVEESQYRSILALSIWENGRDVANTQFAFRTSLDYALALMEINKRDDATRQLKLQENTNAPTFEYLKAVRWENYKNAAIVVPGWSPTISYEPLNPGRKIALRTAARLYKAGVAPLIIVSGAQLRPIGTPYSEAYEMLNYLVKEQGIPANHILINPISRHTTTEIRDNGRMILRTGSPLTKKSLYINEGGYIGTKGLEERLIRDLGYLPWDLLKRTDFTTLEFIPSLNSLQREATDPLNP